MSEERGSSRRVRLLAAVAVPVIAAALIVTGIVLAVATPGPKSFGWFAYGPLPEGTGGLGSPILVTGTMQLGFLLAVLGLLTAAFWAGLRIGRSRAGRRSPHRAGSA
ncbi:hypothetical protein [Arthrobacter zhaoxinii]|uniref:hypothetical protein n=1 Tax=Arthrobacter zhaoxinii TaxID=2964616 RepID=UPI002106C285|nr:hypothetical protein [Arthrobacter zhaoxinii]MCQ2001852.1 hypothetical protein [Arthrobacter zhaoxinii]